MARNGVYAKGVAKREEILRATLRVLARDGAAGTTMRAVAAEADLSLAGVVHYFPTRDELLAETLKQLDRDTAADYLHHGDDPDPGELLADAMARNQVEPAPAVLFVTLIAAVSDDPDHPAAEWLQDRYLVIRSVTAAYLRQQQSLGTVPERVDPEFAAQALVAAADGIQNQWICDRSIDMGAFMRATWRALTN